MTRTFKKYDVWVNETTKGTEYIEVAEVAEGCMVRSTLDPDWPTGHNCNGDWCELGVPFEEECQYWTNEGYEEI